MKSKEKKTRLLLVDDEAEFLEATSRALARRGFEVARARDGMLALAHLRAREFDVAVLDVKMPGIDGVDLFHRIKLVYPALPVILLTGHGTLAQAFQTSREGVFEYLAKPCDIEAIAEVAHRAADAASAGSTSESQRKGAVVADDDVRVLLAGGRDELVQLLAGTREAHGLRLTSVRSAEQALEQVVCEPFDVVVVEGATGGPGVVRLVQQLKTTAPTVEVIVVVEAPSAEETVTALNAGAFAFLRKPEQAGELADAVRSAYRLRKKRQAEEQDRLVREIRERHPD